MYERFMNSQMFKGFLVCFWIWAAADAEVLQCPSCTYITADKSLNAIVRTTANTIIDLFAEPACKSWPSLSATMDTEDCVPPEGQIAMCSHYNGSIDIEIDVFFDSFNVPLKIYQQGCYFAYKANPLSVGCHNRRNINEDKTTLQHVISKATSLVKNVASFEGDLCVCWNRQCHDTSGSPALSAWLLLIVLAQVLASFLLM